MKKEDKRREFLHSLSRISDRMKTLKRDMQEMREELIKDLKNVEEDLNMLSSALDSLFQDMAEKTSENKKLWNTKEI
jgi:flagellar hook-associated protein FlgK